MKCIKSYNFYFTEISNVIYVFFTEKGIKQKPNGMRCVYVTLGTNE
jgi:hypothetical protein